MLDQDLCEMFGIDSFLRNIINQLDGFEEEYYTNKRLSEEQKYYFEIKIQTLKEVRRDYCEFLKIKEKEKRK